MTEEKYLWKFREGKDLLGPRDQERFPKDIPSKAESRRIVRTWIGKTGTPGKGKCVNRSMEV